MLSRETFKKGPKTFAFNPDSLKDSRPSFGLTYSKPHLRADGVVLAAYEIEGYWFSSRASTKNSLVIGKVDFLFASLIGDEDKVKNLSYIDILELSIPSGVSKDGSMEVDIRPRAEALLGDNSVWTNGRNTIKNIEKLVEANKNLPTSPVGYDGWFQLRK